MFNSMRDLLRVSLLSVACACVQAALLAQSYSPLFGPASANSQQWQCLDQYNQPIPWAYFTVSPGVYLYTNGHFHANPGPIFSSVSPSSGYANGNGVFGFQIYTTLTGRAEALGITCSNPYGSVSRLFDYAVGYNDIWWNNHPEVWILIGGNTTGHGDNTFNHWMQTMPAYGIWNTAWAWVNTYNPGGTICVNDMALPYGGKFDIYQNWISPHASHDRGSAVDVATTSNQCPPASVVTNPDAFLQLCVANGAKPYPISQVDPADVHCNWTDPATYPH